MSTIIGMDPGMNTGVAIYQAGKLEVLMTISPLEIHALLKGFEPARVVFEDSRLQSHIWNRMLKAAAAAKVARNVGQIDAWCYLITEHCERLKIAAHGISPAGKGAKLNAAKFQELTGWTGPSNQHTRDAAMVAWPYRSAA